MACDTGHCGPAVSRRMFMKSGTAAAAGGALLALDAEDAEAAAPLAGEGHRSGAAFGQDPDFLANARGAAEWILSTQTRDEHGIFWPPDPDHPEKPATVTPPDSFYSGMAGTTLFFVEMARATGEAVYRDAAVAGADRLAKRWQASLEPAAGAGAPGADSRYSFIAGLSGIAFVLAEAGKALGEPRLIGAAKAVTDRIVADARMPGEDGSWSRLAGIVGDSGTILQLLHASKLLGKRGYLAAAARAGDGLLQRKTEEADGSWSWRGLQNPYAPELYYPNFELGTAGISYTLARLFEDTGDRRYLDAARRGAAHLVSLAAVDGDAALIPYALPGSEDLFYLGYCHGPVGTARTFFKLHQLTGQSEYREWGYRLARGIIRSGAPELESPGYWNTVNQCCGAAGQIDFFLGMWAMDGDPGHLAFARRAGRLLASRATPAEGGGRRWYIAWTRTLPAVVNAETGYAIGAAGIGAAMLHLHLAEAGRYAALTTPDNPFPSGA